MSLKVLVVDDTPDNIDILRRVVSTLDCTVLVATSGERALSLINKNPPDLVLLDVMMPGIDGFEVCTQLRQNPKTADLPIIFVTGRQDDISLGFSVGGNDYITKPINTDEVVARVKHQLERLSLLREMQALNNELEQKVRDRTAKLAVANQQLREEINERRYMQDRLRYLAEHDFVTRLYNRNALDAHIADTIEAFQLRSQPANFLQIDLDRFRLINESCGCIAGDELLKECGELIANCLTKDDFFARIGGDRFAIVSNRQSNQAAQSLAHLIYQQFSEFSFEWDERSFNVGVSIAIVPFNLDIYSFDQLLIMADEVMYLAKKEGGKAISTYNENTPLAVVNRTRINWALRLVDALKFDHFRIFVQKINSLKDNPLGLHEPIKMEALVRLYDASNDQILTPDQFMPSAERFHLTPSIDRWMIEHVCLFLHDHPSLHQQISSISINLSALTLGEPDLCEYIASVLKKYQLPAKLLVFEITETERFVNIESAANMLLDISHLGCQISIDDFGSGYASFNYLRELPFDQIKIDGVFIRDMEHIEANYEMVRSIVDIAAKLNKPVVAEFVERESIATLLKSIGVHWGQGYHFHRPELLTPACIERLSQIKEVV
ncbi:EAL domain-containing protein [Neptunomonas phycophila]|uniref:EAL domain-containing protein n=1 Tax=Neptunomonas phycophila TaxID=1572645 RepID=A0AAW7XHL6_9GAMM|nr:EAL domain-containing protein [Neptunomonas phycophila]MDO6452572.1 EAL domain-containing protein [Neptunomonas phycophila]